MTKIVVLSAGLSQPSSTRLLADRLGEAVAREVRGGRPGDELDVRYVELREHAHAITDTMLTGFAPPALAEVLAAVGEADAVVAVTPVFTASYSGLFKSFVDVLDRDALVGTPVLVAATAGTPRHSLVLEHALRPLFAYLRAIVVPTAVFAATEDFGGADAAARELASRIDRAAAELADLAAGRAPVEDADEPAEGWDVGPAPSPVAAAPWREAEFTPMSRLLGGS